MSTEFEIFPGKFTETISSVLKIDKFCRTVALRNLVSSPKQQKFKRYSENCP